MKKELKYFLYIITIFGFLIFVGTYYFSDQNKKNSFRFINLYDEKLSKYDDKLIFLENNTDNVIDFVENNLTEDKKKYNFWNLLNNDN